MVQEEIADKTGISIETLGLIIEILREAKVEKAVFYGSRARGDWRDPSDIDIAYWGDTDERTLWGKMYDLSTIHKIDIVNFDKLSNEKLKERILQEAMPLL